jgi:endo-1,4-beta-xylanase
MADGRDQTDEKRAIPRLSLANLAANATIHPSFCLKTGGNRMKRITSLVAACTLFCLHAGAASGAPSGLAWGCLPAQNWQAVRLPLGPTGLVAVHSVGVEWEKLPDGSAGTKTSFHGVGDIVIPAYIRKPPGRGPFPVVVLLHGGKFSEQATFGLGRSAKSPVQDFIQAGWAVYAIDYRPQKTIVIDPTENEDCVLAIKAVRRFPFIDPKRVGLHGASHGANLASRLVAREQLSGAVLCAPAAMDLIEVKKALGRGEKLVKILGKLVADMEKKHGATAEEIEKDPKKYGYSSALTEVAEVKCPLLLINGKNDDNSPTSIIDIYVKKLRDAGKSVDTYLPDNGPHGFYYGRPDIPEWKEATKRSVAFFAKCFQESAGKKDPASPPPMAKAKYLYGPMDWVDPDKTDSELLKFKTFTSKTIKADVSYMVYLPPDYEKHPSNRYPVLYHLHASGGTPKRDGANIAKRFDQAIRSGRVDPMIIVCPNGLRGATMYSDSKDGAYPVETVIVKDLIPHVDATFRTVATREGRALDGFSMGGFGAAHFGFKFPEVFGVVSIQAPPLLGPELKQALPAQAWSKLFPTAMGGDLDYFRTNDPFELIAKNADALRDRSMIRIVAHVENENWLAPRCEQMHQLLVKYGIAHQFYYLSNVKSHNRGQCMETMGDAGLAFFGSSFAYLQKKVEGKRPKSGPLTPES